MIRKVERSAISLSFLMAFILMTGTESQATNCAASNQRTIYPGQLPDIAFTVGVPSTRYVRPIQFNFPTTAGLGYTDCHTWMRSNIKGVSIQQSYMIPGEIKPPGQWAAINQSSGPVVPMTYLKIWGYPDVPSGQIAIIYDGAGPVGQGSIDIAVAYDEFFTNKVYLATINVSIVSGTAPSTWFTVTTSASNISGPSVILDHPLLNNHYQQKLFAMHQGGGNWNHPIAVFYDVAGARWRIRNEDETPMPVGLSFFVKVDPTAYRIDTAASNQSHYLIINNALSNNNPYAVIIVTPTDTLGRRMTHPYAVAYAAPYWQILFTDGVAMPTSPISRTLKGTAYPDSSYAGTAGFFVKVLGAGQYVDDLRSSDPTGIVNTAWSNDVGIDLVAASGRISGNQKILSRFCSTNNTSLPALVTMNVTPLPPPAPVNYNFNQAKYYGVNLLGNTATVFYEDGTVMPPTASFNVWAPYRADCPPNPRPSTVGPLTRPTAPILKRGVEPESTPPSPTGEEEKATAPK